MATWAHYRFRQTLKAKSELFPWVTVVECDEAYTSKTCPRCGKLNHKLGGKEVFVCPHDGCGYVASRDGSAARNILLRYLTLNKVMST
jgi:putative transposase